LQELIARSEGALEAKLFNNGAVEFKAIDLAIM
jgi:hypothetical protein